MIAGSTTLCSVRVLSYPAAVFNQKKIARKIGVFLFPFTPDVRSFLPLAICNVFLHPSCSPCDLWENRNMTGNVKADRRRNGMVLLHRSSHVRLAVFFSLAMEWLGGDLTEQHLPFTIYHLTLAEDTFALWTNSTIAHSHLKPQRAASTTASNEDGRIRRADFVYLVTCESTRNYVRILAFEPFLRNYLDQTRLCYQLSERILIFWFFSRRLEGADVLGMIE